jgi:hypothetical protein
MAAVVPDQSLAVRDSGMQSGCQMTETAVSGHGHTCATPVSGVQKGCPEVARTAAPHNRHEVPEALVAWAEPVKDWRG